jgi:Nuclear transport factor 2 (NTF2) domain
MFVCLQYNQAINDKIMSMEVVKAEIETVDSQESLSGGVIVLVTGHLTGRHDGVRREFTQTFFLAPQEKGFFVLNDLFRYTGASVIPVGEHHEPSADSHVHVAGEVLANGTSVHYPTEHGMFLVLLQLRCLIFI